MVQWIDNTLPSWLTAIIIVGGGALLTWLAVRIRHGRTKPGTPDTDNDLMAVFVLIVTGMYGILVAFTIFIVWNNSDRADQAASAEGGEISALARQSVDLAQPGQYQLQQALRAYTESVIHDEWPAMSHSQSSPVTAKLFSAIYQVGYHLPASTVADDMKSELSSLAEARTDLVLLSGSALPYLFWFTLIIGAVLSIGLSVFFFTEIPRAHGLMAVAAAVLICGSLWLILEVDYPFSGLSVQPDAFERALDTLNSLRSGQL
jgi:hypothetical protein